jgi:hypothetical protein
MEVAVRVAPQVHHAVVERARRVRRTEFWGEKGRRTCMLCIQRRSAAISSTQRHSAREGFGENEGSVPAVF